MDKFFRQRTLAAVLFLTFIFTISFFSVRLAWNPLQYSVAMLLEKRLSRSSVSELEAVINNSIYQKHRLIDAFGYLQRLIYKNEQSNFETLKDSGGMLHEAHFTSDADNTLTLVENMRKLRVGVANDTPILYIMPPDKNIKGFTAFSTGLPYNNANETADSFLRMLSLYNINAVDLRERIRESGVPLEKLFYKTDNRWTTEANFWAFTELVEIFREQYGMSFDADGFFTAPNHYNRITYPASYLGDLGKKAGKYYAEVDDFTVIYPKFDTDYTVRMGYSRLDEYTMNGKFEDVLLSSEPFRHSESTDYALSDKYSSYLLVNRGVSHIRNNGNTNGHRIAFVSDSMVTPAASFLSTACSDIYMIDPVYFSGDIYEVLNNPELELIVVSFCPKNLNQAYFSF